MFTDVLNVDFMNMNKNKEQQNIPEQTKLRPYHMLLTANYRSRQIHVKTSIFHTLIQHNKVGQVLRRVTWGITLPIYTDYHFQIGNERN